MEKPIGSAKKWVKWGKNSFFTQILSGIKLLNSLFVCKRNMADPTFFTPNSLNEANAATGFWAVFLFREKALDASIEKLRQGSNDDKVNAVVLRGKKEIICSLLSCYIEELRPNCGPRITWEMIDGLLIEGADKGYVGSKAISIIQAEIEKEAPGVSMADFAKDYLPKSYALREVFELANAVEGAQEGKPLSLHTKSLHRKAKSL